MLDQAFEALKTFDWGQDIKVLAAIDEAVVATHEDAAKRKELEDRLAATLIAEMPLDAKQFVCRQLRVIGTASSVPALAGLLSDENLSHMARFALERIPAAEAGSALRDALPKLAGALKVGVMSSLGTRQDTASVPALGEMLGDGDVAVARAAAYALGVIRTPEAAKALAQAEPAGEVKSAVTDASFACAESLLSAGKNLDALAIYKGLAAGDPPKHVKLAATRGMLECAGKK
ncbi:MAG: HEAT repeat domain-containing protein [Planctomycetota bacterium]